MPIIQLTLAQWRAIAEPKFGTDIKKWKFKCCNCNQTQSLQEFMDAGIQNPHEKFFFSCIGRWVKDRGCKWTLGGLLTIHETEVINEVGKSFPVFEFSESNK